MTLPPSYQSWLIFDSSSRTCLTSLQVWLLIHFTVHRHLLSRQNSVARAVESEVPFMDDLQTFTESWVLTCFM